MPIQQQVYQTMEMDIKGEICRVSATMKMFGLNIFLVLINMEIFVFSLSILKRHILVLFFEISHII